jgi:hypothetical protein
MDGKMARARRWKCEKFQHNNLSTKIGEEKSEEGFSLYLKRQREGTWMNAKCWFKSKRANL